MCSPPPVTLMVWSRQPIQDKQTLPSEFVLGLRETAPVSWLPPLSYEQGEWGYLSSFGWKLAAGPEGEGWRWVGQGPWEMEREDSWVSHSTLGPVPGRVGTGPSLHSPLVTGLSISGATAHSALRFGEIHTFILNKSQQKTWG